MSKLSKIFQDIPVDIQNRSGFDMSHYNLGDARCGTLVPVLTEEILPGDTVSLGIMDKITMAPMATAFSGRVDMRFEAFFCPMRILWGGWQDFQTLPDNDPYQDDVLIDMPLPHFANEQQITTANFQDFYRQYFGPGSLLDYLGCMSALSAFSPLSSVAAYDSRLSINAMPAIAYQRIYDEWYRNPRITKPLFVRPKGNASSSNYFVSNLPWISLLNIEQTSDSTKNTITYGSNIVNQLNDGSSLLDLRQRCWGDDYFTTAALYPQANGAISGKSVSIDTSGSTGSFSIADLRTANVLQRWAERRNIAGPRYADQLLATWGVMPSDALIDRPIYLGSYSHGVYTSPIFNQTQPSEGTSVGTNPFSAYVGSSAGNTTGFGKDSLVDGFKSTEHGYLMVIMSFVPHSFYSSGLRRYLKRFKVGDFANPLLQGLGEQAIHRSEITGILLNFSESVQESTFGYTPQYSDYKYHNDEIHGLRRDGVTATTSGSGALAPFALQRFTEGNQGSLTTSFLEIPISFMDQVANVTVGSSGFTYMYDLYFDFKIIRTLSEYVIPTLGDPKDVHKERIPFRGRQIKG